jgi:uncharacterized protein DUF1592/uncharacterized protein DUF1588/uncharacterized protein DUF1595/uncharacterized protein DUF1587/uncharacterized protein DUF1585
MWARGEWCSRRWFGRRAMSVVLATVVGGAGCIGSIGDGGSEGGGSGPPGGDTQLVPAEPTIYRLTQIQLQNAFAQLFGDPLVVPTDLPADDQLYGFTSIAAAGKTIAPLDAEKYETAAYMVLDQVWSDAARREALVGCAPSGPDDPCVRSFFEAFASRAWRRPAEAAEVDALVALGSDVAADLADGWEGIRFALAAVLQSPHFLFRIELGEPDPSGYLRFTSWEMASRLSFLLTDAPPDDALFQAAKNGELVDPVAVKTQAKRLLADERARPALVRFFRDFMNIGRLDQLDKSGELFPQLSPTLGPAMRVEIEKLFEATVFETKGDFRQLFTSRETFVNEELAALYGIEGVAGADFVPATLPESRAGLLTTAGFLAMNAHKTMTSPTHRGRFVRISLLCQDVPPPPPGVDTTIPESDPSQPTTLRQRLEAHRENSQCEPCHAKMDPIGFAFEHFDAIGAWRDTENGLPLDTSTDVDGAPVADAVEMGELVAELPAVGDCIARRFYQHATAHLDKVGERKAVDALVASFVASDYDFEELVLELVVNDGFRYASPIPAEEVGP